MKLLNHYKVFKNKNKKPQIQCLFKTTANVMKEKISPLLFLRKKFLIALENAKGHKMNHEDFFIDVCISIRISRDKGNVTKNFIHL